MAHFAKVLGDKVTQVIVAEPEFFDTFIDSTPGMWIQTSYNTLGGQHLLGGEPLRKNFAGIGFTYDYNLDAYTMKTNISLATLYDWIPKLVTSIIDYNNILLAIV
jgi:hypothetical protein